MSLSCFLSGTCQNAEPKSRVVKNFASPNLERLSSILGIPKVATKPQLVAFLFGHHYSIISYSSNVSISFLHVSDLCGVMRLAPSLCGTAESSSSISISTKLQHPMSALCLEKTSSFRSSTSLMASSCSSVTYPLSALSQIKLVYPFPFPLVLVFLGNLNSSRVRHLYRT